VRPDRYLPKVSEIAIERSRALQCEGGWMTQNLRRFTWTLGGRRLRGSPYSNG
jgi:hypothetical protein